MAYITGKGVLLGRVGFKDIPVGKKFGRPNMIWLFWKQSKWINQVLIGRAICTILHIGMAESIIVIPTPARNKYDKSAVKWIHTYSFPGTSV